MELEVFSDPLWALGQLVGPEISLATRYDEEILKPALLLADKVTLRSWRLDTRFRTVVDGNVVKYGIPLQSKIKEIVDRADQRELSWIGVDAQLYRALQGVLDRHGPRLRSSDGMAGAQFFHSEAVREFTWLYVEAHRRAYEALTSEALNSLEHLGVLQQYPWDDRPPQHSFIETYMEPVDTIFEYGWQAMATALEDSHAAVLLDRGIDDRLHSSTGTIDYASTKVLANAADLLRVIEGLSTASLDEIVDIRAELKDYLTPFRRFIVSQARGTEIDPEAPLGERRRLVALKWQLEVAPAVEELEAALSPGRFGSTLVEVASDGPEAVIGIGLGLTTMLASGGLGITALAGLGVAALPTIAKAAFATHRDRRAARKDGAYFIYEASRRLNRS